MMNCDQSDFYIGVNPPNHVPPNAEIKAETYKKCFQNITCKLLKITKGPITKGPIFYFEINGKIYFYGIIGIKADYKIHLQCTKIINKSKCANLSVISPSEKGKVIIINRPKRLYAQFPKILNKSDPRIYDIENYDINSFEICGAHKCSGTETELYMNKNIPVKCKLLKIRSSHHRSDLITFHFKINEKI